ncbi:thiol-disulfide oxidoreductase DCC family protein [Niveispirillum irakense]|uniref:thiol-disulfide oxidoreductase DCC family protein n=1 Tax=Niveispirillum irakense TaxID=34011 RepID=UPI0004153354|nr:DCC1-like thiol-disulfide oxidoreductase family protein [Niveispirillum irakense]
MSDLNDNTPDPAVLERLLLGPTCLFDGVCNLCNGSVRFILATEEDHEILFVAVQSPTGRRVLEAIGMPDLTNSFVYIDEGVASLRSVAAFRLARRLRAPWSWVRLFQLLPTKLTDWLYNRLADNRYRLFGKRELCLVPTPGQSQRFVS